MSIRITVMSLAACCCAAWAETESGIAVTGVGTVQVKPTVAELTFGIDANAEVAGDAITRFEQTRSRAVEALTQLQLPNATLVHEAFSVGVGGTSQQQMMQIQMMGGRAPKGPAQVTLSQPITLHLTAIDKLSREQLIEQLTRVIDTARDLGLNLSGAKGQGMVRFVVEKPEEARTKALELAFADARRQGEDLAGRAKVKLGPVLALKVNEDTGKRQQQAVPNYYSRWMVNMAGDDGDETAIEATSFTDIAVSVSVQIRYAITGE